MAAKPPYSVIVLPDMHVPKHDKKALKAVLNYVADNPVNEIVILGDFMDMDCISSHNEKNLRAVAAQTLQNDYEEGQKVLDSIVKAGGGADVTLLEGNHEYRVERYVDANPQVEGMIEIEKGLDLSNHNVGWVRFWSKGEIYKVGKCSFIHGRYTNEHHAKRHAIDYGGNVVYGHTHDVQQHSLVRVGEHDTVVAQSLGCLCEYAQPYMHGAPSKWQQAFGQFYFWPNGEFQYYVGRLFGGRFFGPNGKEYKS